MTTPRHLVALACNRQLSRGGDFGAVMWYGLWPPSSLLLLFGLVCYMRNRVVGHCVVCSGPLGVVLWHGVPAWCGTIWHGVPLGVVLWHGGPLGLVLWHGVPAWWQWNPLPLLLLLLLLEPPTSCNTKYHWQIILHFFAQNPAIVFITEPTQLETSNSFKVANLCPRYQSENQVIVAIPIKNLIKKYENC